jgi:hypothetical protein
LHHLPGRFGGREQSGEGTLKTAAFTLIFAVDCRRGETRQDDG